MSLLAAVPVAGLTFGRVMNVLMDQRIVDDTGEDQGERTFTIRTSALTPQIAKIKARIFTLGLRPKRKIVDIVIETIEEGIFLKRYQMTVKTILFKKEETEESVE